MGLELSNEEKEAIRENFPKIGCAETITLLKEKFGRTTCSWVIYDQAEKLGVYTRLEAPGSFTIPKFNGPWPKLPA